MFGRRSGASRTGGRQRQMLRPTLAAAVLSIVAAACMVLGLSFDDRVFLAVSTALIFALLLSGVLTLLQWLASTPSLVSTLEDFNPRFRFEIRRGGRLRSLLLPHDMPLVEQWVQLDHRGEVVGRFRASLPHARGLFRLESLMVTWRDPFGLWKARKNIGRHGDEMVLLPDVGDAADRTAKLPTALPAGNHQSMSGVRNYEFGDSPRMIAWKYTAHRGELMTRESLQEQSADTLWLLDPADADLESCVIELLAHLHAFAPRSEEKLLYSDGTGIYREAKSVFRQLAAVHHSPAETMADAVPWSDLPDAILTFRDGTIPGPMVNVVSTRPDDAIAAMMESSGRRGDYRILHPDVRADAEVFALTDTDQDGHAVDSAGIASMDRRSEDYPSAAQRSRKRRSMNHRSENQSGAESNHPSRHFGDGHRSPERRFGAVKTLVTVICIGVLAAVTIRTMSGVFGGQDAWWPYFLPGGFALIAIDVGLCMRRGAQSLSRAFGCCAAVVLLALLAVMVHIHQIRGYWLFVPHAQQVSVPAGSVAEDWEPVTTTLWDAMVNGFSHMYAQYPPVEMNVEADALLIVAAAVLMVLIRIMLIQPRCASVMALLTAVMMATTYQITGEQPETTSIGLVVLAGMLLLWSTSSIRISCPVPMLPSVAVTTLSVAMLAPMLVVAQAVSIPIVPSAGLFSSGAINPMVDLKRGLQEGSSATALTYRAPAAVYTRLSTLDRFDGDTWSFGTPGSVDASRFPSAFGDAYTQVGDGYLLGGNNDADIIWVTPLMKYLVANDPDESSERFIRSSQDSDHYVLDATVTIDALRTRYLPVSGEVLLYSGDARDGNWHRNVDGAYRSDTESTWPGMRYRVQSLYIKPVSNLTDFDRIDDLQQVIARRKAWLVANPDALNGSSGSSEALATMDTRIGDDTGTGRQLKALYGTLPATLPESVRSVISQAKRQGVPTDGSDATEQLAAMKYLVDYFKQPDFVYSLDEPDGNGRDNMAMVGEFLRSKSGYCVHYASALAVLGRGLGLSTRMVLGYTPGRSVGDGTYAVAEKQLHAWVESYIDGIGWVPFDVTPAAADESGTAESAPGDASSTSQSSPVQSQTPVPSTSSASAAPSGSASQGADTSSDDRGNAASSTQDGRGLNRILAFLGIVFAVALVLLLLASPALMRLRKRRRRYRLLDKALAFEQAAKTGGDAPDVSGARSRTSTKQPGIVDLEPDVWMALWQEIVDTAIDAGKDFPDTIGDIPFAKGLADLLSAEETSAAAHPGRASSASKRSGDGSLCNGRDGLEPDGSESTGPESRSSGSRSSESEGSESEGSEFTGSESRGGDVRLLSDIVHAAVQGAFSPKNPAVRRKDGEDADRPAPGNHDTAPGSMALPSRQDFEMLLEKITSRLFRQHPRGTIGIFRIRALLLPKSLFR